MKIHHAVVGLTFLAALQDAVHAVPKVYKCPQFIPDAAVSLIGPGKEWRTFVSSPLYLSGAAPADGPPERLGVLRGDDSRKTKTGWTHTYSLAGPYPEGKWLRCDYGHFGEVSLAKRLPDEVKQCAVTGKKGVHAGESQIEIKCI